MELSIRLSNYGVTPNKEYNLQSGTIFFIKGPNETGKSTFLNALKALMEVKDEKVNPVKFGNTEGSIIGSLPGADGKQYQVRYDFDTSGKKKFTFLRDDGTKVSSITEMRAIFDYNHITASDWLMMSRTEPGRRKQIEYFINLMSSDEKMEIANIDSLIDTKKGTLFTKRTTVNLEVDALNARLSTFKITPEDKIMLAKKAGANELINTLKIRRKEIDEFFNANREAMVNIESLEKRIDEKTLDAGLKKQDIIRIENQIEELKKQLEITRNSVITIEKTINDDKATLGEYRMKLDESTIQAMKKELDGYTNAKGEEILGIDERIEKGNEILNKIDVIEKLETERTKIFTEYESKVNEQDQLNKDIESWRTRRREIIKMSKNIPTGWSIEDDYLSYNGVPFVEQDISTSRSIRAVAELMIHINKAPIMLMGDSEVLGYPVLDELKTIAKAYDRIMVFAEHDRNYEDIELVCYDDIRPEDETTNTKSSNLF